MKLDQQFIELVRGPILDTWQYIGSDCEQCAAEMGERLDNEAAIEGCIDANRLTSCAMGDKAKAQAAEAAITEAIKAHKYTKVLKFLSKHIRLA